MNQKTIIIISIVCVLCIGIGLAVYFMMKNNNKGSGCSKNCKNKSCGPDGCGGICGVCSGSGQTCQNGSCSAPPPSGLLG